MENKIMKKKENIKKTYSQKEQDLWVVKKLRAKKNGFFVEAGAGDGIILSNTYLLEKKFDWNGICIEPYQPNFVKLEKNRSCKCVCALLDDKVRKQLYTPGAQPGNTLPLGYKGGIVSKDSDNKNPEGPMKSLTMNTVTLEHVLDEQSAPKIIDYFSLDVEGLELQILKDFPFNRYKFRILHIERPGQELCEILKNNGYIIDGGNPYDTYFTNFNLS